MGRATDPLWPVGGNHACCSIKEVGNFLWLYFCCQLNNIKTWLIIPFKMCLTTWGAAMHGVYVHKDPAFEGHSFPWSVAPAFVFFFLERHLKPFRGDRENCTVCLCVPIKFHRHSTPKSSMNCLRIGAKLGRHPTAFESRSNKKSRLSAIRQEEVGSRNSHGSISLHSQFPPT